MTVIIFCLRAKAVVISDAMNVYIGNIIKLLRRTHVNFTFTHSHHTLATKHNNR